MNDIFKHETKSREPFTLTKTRKALDWALSCIIRLPIAVVFLGVVLAAVGFVALIFAPDNVLNALRLLGVVI